MMVAHTLDDRNNLVDVALVVGDTVVSDRELAVRRLCVAVTVGQIVDDDLDELASAHAGGISHVGVQARNLGDRVEPDEGRDARNLGGLRSGGRVRDLGDGSGDFVGVVRAQVSLHSCFIDYRNN